MRKLLVGGLWLVALAIVGAVLWTRVADRYQRDGTLELAILSAPVRVIRDEQGIPYIHAASLDDALRAQGWVTAQDRGFQLEFERYLVQRPAGGTGGRVGARSRHRAAPGRHASARRAPGGHARNRRPALLRALPGRRQRVCRGAGSRAAVRLRPARHGPTALDARGRDDAADVPELAERREPGGRAHRPGTQRPARPRPGGRAGPGHDQPGRRRHRRARPGAGTRQRRGAPARPAGGRRLVRHGPEGPRARQQPVGHERQPVRQRCTGAGQ